MRKTLAAAVAACCSVGCGKKPDSQHEVEPAPVALQAQPVREHNYDFHEGVEYGYTMAPTESNARDGVAASRLTMLRYAGQRDGKYQLHAQNGAVLTAVECTYPCDVAKIMIIMDMQGVPASSMNIQRVRLNADAVAMLAIEDASKGKLKQYGREIDGRKYSVWMDQEKGVVLTRLKSN